MITLSNSIFEDDNVNKLKGGKLNEFNYKRVT